MGAPPDSEGPRYAVVVATKDRGSKIVALLESIGLSDTDDYELVVVDQSTADDTEKAMAPFLADPRITYARSSVPGTSRARNRGIAITTAPYIVITDDDCTVPPNWLTAICHPFEVHESVGVVFCNVEPVPVAELGVTPQVHFPANRVITSVRDVWGTSSHGLALGAGMAIRRAMLADVQGFDEVLGPGATFPAAEDNDLAWRGLLRGWWTYHTPDVAVIHDGFRPMAELRQLVTRDFLGVGGTAAKYLRVRQWQVLRFLLSWIVQFGVVEPARDVLARRRPRGLRRPYMMVRGVFRGLRTPFDPATIRYRVDH
jgi:glycosyltransferase involved in cell wall biosynthesis